ncbi:MAG: type II toxin-antitoxin system RelE/ParE family toxin [Amaricoccus sp.]
MRYRLSRAAASDLRALYAEGIERFGPPHADRYLDRLENSLDLLALNPGMARERAELSPPARIHPVGSHIIVYVAQVDGILVVRIRHAREDWAAS